MKSQGKGKDNIKRTIQDAKKEIKDSDRLTPFLRKRLKDKEFKTKNSLSPRESSSSGLAGEQH